MGRRVLARACPRNPLAKPLELIYKYLIKLYIYNEYWIIGQDGNRI